MCQEETMGLHTKEAMRLRVKAVKNPTQIFEEYMDCYNYYSRYYDDVSKHYSIIIPSLN